MKNPVQNGRRSLFESKIANPNAEMIATKLAVDISSTATGDREANAPSQVATKATMQSAQLIEIFIALNFGGMDLSGRFGKSTESDNKVIT